MMDRQGIPVQMMCLSPIALLLYPHILSSTIKFECHLSFISFSMQLDPNPSPRVYKPNANNDESSTCYTKYVFREQPADWTYTRGDTLPYDDIASDEFSQILDENESTSHAVLTQPTPLKLKDEQFPRILFLGTSSADSYLLRNSTGILVHLS